MHHRATILSAFALSIGLPCGAAYPDATSAPLVQQSDIAYIGAFRVPVSDSVGCVPSTGSHCFYHGGHALGYNAANNSLFFGGHAWQQQLAEISIPSVIDLNHTAQVLQDLVDVSDGAFAEVINNTLGGSLVYNNRLIVDAYVYYGPDGVQTVSHGVSGMNLATNGDFRGFYPISADAHPRGVSGFMTTIPSEWQPLLGGPAVTGHCCSPGNQETSNGPAATVFDPDDVGVVSPIPGNTLLYYPFPLHPLAQWDGTNEYYNLATVIRGVAFPSGTRSILFIGRQGIGEYCYGEGTNDESLHGLPTPEGTIYCYDPTDSAKGTHAFPYRHQIWAYDANELLAVKNGQKNYWEPRPYALITLDAIDSTGRATIKGAAFDPDSNRIFLTEAFGDEPIVHVFKVSPGSDPGLAAPTNLQLLH